MMQAREPDPLDALTPENRYGIYAALRANRPVHWSACHVGWVLTRYADVAMILRHQNALALDVLSGMQQLHARGGPALPSLVEFCASLSLLTRPPRHAAIRRLLSAAMGGLRDLDLPAMLERKAGDLLDRAASDGGINLADGYARELALFVIGAFLGIEPDDLCRLGGQARDFMVVFERSLPSLRVLRQLDQTAHAMMSYFTDLITRRRRTPGQDGLSLMVKLAAEETAGMETNGSDHALAACCMFFFIAAEETTSAAIATAAQIVLQRPELRQALTDRPRQLAAACRDLVRLASPIQYVVRTMSVDLNLHGVHIPAGEPIYLMLGAANRDPDAFSNPDEPDLARDGPEPLDFAAGPYRCIGKALALFEVETALRKIIERPRLALSPDPPVWCDRMNVAPLQTLNAYFE
jgi:cytochrome P450